MQGGHPIDISGFGDNLFRSRLALRDGVLIIGQRGWLFALVFFGIAAVLAGIIIREKAVFAGGEMALYLGAGAMALIGLLYAAYVHEVIFDFRRRRLRVCKGFRGLVRIEETPFEAIASVDVREVRMTSRRADANVVLKSWDVGITVHAASPASPLFDFWRTDSEQTAMRIAGTLASHLGCGVRMARRP